MMDSIGDSVVRVSVITNNKRESGSGFFISKKHIVTASHVLLPEDDDTVKGIKEILITNNEGIMVKGDLLEFDRELDFAVVELSDSVGKSFLAPPKSIPKIGTDCVWCGYPLLIGESTKRKRFGWGKVSSEPYGEKKNKFEIDGNFSPAHSGSPVLDSNTGELVGMVTRSAGDPRLHFINYRKYIQALKFLSSKLDLPSRLLESYKDLIQKLGLSREVDIPEDSQDFVKEGIPERWGTQIPTEIVEVLKQIGVETEEESYLNLDYLFDRFDRVVEKESIETVSVIGFHTILEGVVSLILQITDSIEEAVDKTFQMGIGVVSGGSPLADFVMRYSQ